LKPPLKLSLAALETLAVVAYKQPVTGPEILEIRGVQGGGVLKTLLERGLRLPRRTAEQRRTCVQSSSAPRSRGATRA